MPRHYAKLATFLSPILESLKGGGLAIFKGLLTALERSQTQTLNQSDIMTSQIPTISAYMPHPFGGPRLLRYDEV